MNAATPGSAEVGQGELGMWVGVAAQMISGDTPGFGPKRSLAMWHLNVESEGVGQMANIMLPFHYSQVQQSMGYAEANKPFYDKKMWDDDGAWLPPITLRTAVDIGVAVTIAAATARSNQSSL